MSEQHFQVEMRKSTSALFKEWAPTWTFETEIQAQERILWWIHYDDYYSCEGWEYRIVPVKARKKK